MSADAAAIRASTALTLQRTPDQTLINGHHLNHSVRFAYELGRRYYAPMTTINARIGGDAVMQQVDQAWHDGVTSVRGWYYVRSMFYERVVFIGVVSTVSHCHSESHNDKLISQLPFKMHLVDVESTTAPREIIFSSLELSPELSTSIERPELLQHLECFSQHFPDIVTGSMAKKFLVVVLQVKKQTVLRTTLCALLASAVVGLVVGLMAQSMQAGFACFGGLGAAISMALGIMLEMHK